VEVGMQDLEARHGSPKQAGRGPLAGRRPGAGPAPASWRAGQGGVPGRRPGRRPPFKTAARGISPKSVAGPAARQLSWLQGRTH
jgi:hypothetical protein